MDPNKLHELFVSRIPMLRAYLEQRIPVRLRSMIGADDVIQEIWLCVHRNAHQFKPRDDRSFDAWLMTIARHRLIDFLRRARRKCRGGDAQITRDVDRLRSYSALYDEIEALHETPSRACHAADTAQIIRILLSRLSPPRREAIELHYIQGLPIRDVAQRMGRTKAAVHSLLAHGRRDLGALLGKASKYFSDVPDSGDSLLAPR